MPPHTVSTWGRPIRLFLTFPSFRLLVLLAAVHRFVRKASRSQNSSAQTPSQGFPSAEKRTSTSTESNLSTSPPLCRRSEHLDRLILFSQGRCCEEEKSLQPSNHQEYKPQWSLYMNILRRWFHTCRLCCIYVISTCLFRLELPGCKYLLKNGKQAISNSGNCHCTCNLFYWTSDKLPSTLFFVLPGSLSTHPAILN